MVRKFLAALFVATVAIVVSGCNKNTNIVYITSPLAPTEVVVVKPAPSPESPTNPNPPTTSCSLRLGPENQRIKYTGESNTFGVTVSGGCGCDWKAESDKDWITVLSMQKNNDCNGGVIYRVELSRVQSEREGHIKVTTGSFTAIFTITQDPAPAPPPVVVTPPPATPSPTPGNPTPPGSNPTPGVPPVTQSCPITVASSHTVPAAGGNTGISVDTPAGCTWSASSNASWSRIVGGSPGSGPTGNILVTTDPKTGAGRSATITIVGSTETKTVTINQP